MAAAIGSPAALPSFAGAAEPIDQVWSSASPVQAYGIAPPNRNPGQAGGRVQLFNDADSGGDVWFLLDGQEQSLKPGQTLDLAGDRPHLVEFNTGGAYGDLRFTLYEGPYKFKAMPEGWALFKSSSQSSSSQSSSLQRGPVAGGAPQGQRGYTPPMPAEDLRSRRVARGAEGNSGNDERPAAPLPAPTPGIRAGQEATPTIAPPPAPGVSRPRTNAPQTP